MGNKPSWHYQGKGFGSMLAHGVHDATVGYPLGLCACGEESLMCPAISFGCRYFVHGRRARLKSPMIRRRYKK